MERINPEVVMVMYPNADDAQESCRNEDSDWITRCTGRLGEPPVFYALWKREGSIHLGRVLTTGEIEDRGRAWTWSGTEAVVYLAYVDYDRWCPSAQLPPSVITATAYGLLREAIDTRRTTRTAGTALLGRVRRDADEAMAKRLREQA